MSKIAHAIETGLFRARWLLMPLYVGLVGVLILLAIRFVQEFVMIISHFGDKKLKITLTSKLFEILH